MKSARYLGVLAAVLLVARLAVTTASRQAVKP